jgi:hypothetical protein
LKVEEDTAEEATRGVEVAGKPMVDTIFDDVGARVVVLAELVVD